MNVIGDVKGQTCIIVDDIIDSGGTIVNAAKALKAKGAKEVFVYITHGVLSGDAVKKIKNSVIKTNNFLNKIRLSQVHDEDLASINQRVIDFEHDLTLHNGFHNGFFKIDLITFLFPRSFLKYSFLG